MKNIGIILLLLVCLPSINGTNPKVPKIKSIKTVVYQAVLKDTTWVPGPVAASVTLDRFAPDGKRIAKYQLNPDGSVKNKTILKYNEVDKLEEVLKYNDKAELFNSGTYDYYENGDVKTYTSKDYSGKILHIVSYTYNDRHKLMSEEKKSSAGMLFESRIYTYDDAKRKRECKMRTASGTVTLRLVSGFNEKGNQISQQVFGMSGQMDEAKDYTYEYDCNGNWICKTEYTDGEKEFFIKREIDYGEDAADVRRLSLNGRVKSLQQTSYLAVSKGDDILRGKKQGEFVDYTFNKEGNIISETSYTDAGVLLSMRRVEYDTLGNISKEIYTAPNGTTQSYALFKYDKDQRLKWKRKYDADHSVSFKTVYHRDPEGNPAKVITYQKDGKVYLEYNSLFDAYGNQVESNSPVRPSDAAEYNNVLRLFNFQGRIEVESVYSPSDSLLLNRTYKYSPSGEVVSGSSCEPGKDVVSFVYKFYRDKHDNWKKRIKFVNGKPILYEERVYTYYEDN